MFLPNPNELSWLIRCHNFQTFKMSIINAFYLTIWAIWHIPATLFQTAKRIKIDELFSNKKDFNLAAELQFMLLNTKSIKGKPCENFSLHAVWIIFFLSGQVQTNLDAIFDFRPVRTVFFT